MLLLQMDAELNASSPAPGDTFYAAAVFFCFAALEGVTSTQVVNFYNSGIAGQFIKCSGGSKYYIDGDLLHTATQYTLIELP